MSFFILIYETNIMGGFTFQTDPIINEHPSWY